MTLEDRMTQALRQPPASQGRAALDLRVRAAIDSARPRRGRRIRVTRGLVLAGLLAIGLPGAIAAGIYLTESPLGLADAVEYAAELDAAMGIVPLPEGRSWPDFLRPTDPHAGYSRGGGLPTVESVAMCIWFDEWLDARAAADPAREATAAKTIAEIPRWESWNSAFFDQSYRDHFGPIIAAVGRDQPAPVRAEMSLNCSWVAEQ
jgi:hypothetical protein